MGVPNHIQYTVSAHAQDRALTRFNITKGEIGTWMSRLLSQAVYDETQGNNKVLYHWHSIYVVVDSKQKVVITLYTKNEDNVQVEKGTLNPEVQTMFNQAIESYASNKKIKIAKEIKDDVAKMLDSCEHMVKPRTNYRYSNKSWEILSDCFERVAKEIETGKMLIKEAQTFQEK